jgi:C4-dicarboxylate-specific signal transduction histidine kinase
LAEGKNLNPSGVGMGLYISSLIVKKLQGRLKLEKHSANKNGSTFTVELEAGVRA